MKNIKQTCIDFLSNSDTRKEMFEFIKPIANDIYNELYIYLWIICFYSVCLFMIILANLFLLLKLINKKELYTL